MFEIINSVFFAGQIPIPAYMANAIFDISKLTHAEYNGKDYNGVILSIFGIIVVFLALLLLSYAVKGITKILTLSQKKRVKVEDKATVTAKEMDIPEEVNVAIAMALHMHFAEMHDEESGILTIETIRRNYSPWSSKVYNITRRPGRSIV